MMDACAVRHEGKNTYSTHVQSERYAACDPGSAGGIRLEGHTML